MEGFPRPTRRENGLNSCGFSKCSTYRNLSAIGQLTETSSSSSWSVYFRFFKLYLKIKIVLRIGIRVSHNHCRHKTCSFTSEQSLMPQLFVQVKRNVCFTVKEYMHCSFVTD